MKYILTFIRDTLYQKVGESYEVIYFDDDNYLGKHYRLEDGDKAYLFKKEHEGTVFKISQKED